MKKHSYGVTDIPIKWDGQDNEDDLLNIIDYLKGLQAFIVDCPTPISIAIQGDWGTGKTSMINYLKKELDKRQDIGTIYFNTWQYSQFDMSESLYFSFLAAIMREISNEKFQKIGKRLLSCLLATGKGVIGSVTNIDAEQMDNIVNTVFENQNKAIQEISELHDEFANIVANALKERNQKRMVIFIDDLDRLPPNVAVELLEVMKLFMDVEQCVFVLAIDYDVVVQGVRQKYGGNLSLSKCRSFFDKIIQLAFRMPVEAYQLEGMFQSHLNDIVAKEYHSALIEMAQATIGKNPRAFKRMVNSYQLVSQIYESKEILKEPADKAALFCCLCIQSSCEEAYTLLLQSDSWTDEKTDLADFSSESENEPLSVRLRKLYPNAERIEEDTLFKVENILDILPKIVNRLYKKEDNGMRQLYELLQASSITATSSTSSAVANRKASTKINRIILGETEKTVKTATDAIVETFAYYLNNTNVPLDIFLKEQPKVITDDAQKTSSAFRQRAELKIRDKTLWLGTSTGFGGKTKEAQKLCQLLNLPPETVKWCEDDNIIWKNQ